MRRRLPGRACRPRRCPKRIAPPGPTAPRAGAPGRLPGTPAPWRVVAAAAALLDLSKTEMKQHFLGPKVSRGLEGRFWPSSEPVHSRRAVYKTRKPKAARCRRLAGSPQKAERKRAKQSREERERGREQCRRAPAGAVEGGAGGRLRRPQSR
jgi:hypothetical protein